MCSFWTTWDTLVAPESIDLGPQIAQHRARSKMAFWGDLPCEASFAPDSIDLGTPERTLAGVIFQSCFAPDSIDLFPQIARNVQNDFIDCGSNLPHHTRRGPG